MFWTPIFLGSFILYQDTSQREDNNGNRAISSKETKTSSERIYTYKKPVLKKTKVDGDLKKEKIAEKVELKSNQFKSCFKKNSPKKINVEYKINQDGTVSKKSIITTKDGQTEKCIVQIIQDIYFPRSGGQTKVNQTFGDPTVENEGYSGLQNHFCKRRVLNWLIYARIKILGTIDETHYRASFQSLEKIICEYSQEFPLKSGQIFILKTDEKLDFQKNCAKLALARTWQVYDPVQLEDSISLWVWKIAPISFLVDQLYNPPDFYKCKP